MEGKPGVQVTRIRCAGGPGSDVQEDQDQMCRRIRILTPGGKKQTVRKTKLWGLAIRTRCIKATELQRGAAAGKEVQE